MTLIEKSRIQRAFGRSLESYDKEALVQQKLNHRLLSYLAAFLPSSTLGAVLEFGCGTGQLSEQLQQRFQAEHWAFNDLCDVTSSLNAKLTQPFEFYCGDAERFLFERKYDLIISASAVQWLHHKAAFIEHCKAGLKSQGFLVIATFGENNLQEIRELTQLGLDYPDLSDWKAWLKEDFELHYAGLTTETLIFSNPLEVLQHLKKTGVTATGTGHWTKQKRDTFVAQYQARFGLPSGQVRLTYQPLWFIAQYKK